MDAEFASRARQTLDAALQAGIPGVVAMARDRSGLLFAEAAGVRRLGHPAPMTLDTVFALFSCTKPLTAAVALKLVEDGRLDLDRPAKDYLPALGAVGVLDGLSPDGSPRLRPPKRDITARMLMLHTAGFGYDFANPAIRRLLDDGRLTPHRTSTYAGFDQPLVNEPGERWEYGLSIDWLGMVAERAAGATLDVLLDDLVLRPLGMTETTHRPTPEMRARLAAMHQRGPDGSVAAIAHGPRETLEVVPGGGAMYGTVGDYLRFLGLWLNDGAGVLKPETVAWAVRDGLDGLDVRPLPTTDPALSRPVEMFPGLAKGWAYSFMILREPAPTGRPAGALSWAGLGNLYFWIDRANGIAGFWASQLFPFLDPAACGAALTFETELYAALARERGRRAE